MKKTGIIILASLMILAMVSCGKSEAHSEAELFDVGLEVTKTMQEMAYSNEYISLYTSMDVEEEIVKFQATDYDSPVAVYSIELSNVKDALSKLGIDKADGYDKLSENLKEQVEYKVSLSSVVGVINTQNNVNTVALCSLLTATKHNEGMTLDKSVSYLYVFEKGVPILVTFSASDYAKGQFVLLGDSKTYDDIKEIFEKYYCKVEKIK